MSVVRPVRGSTPRRSTGRFSAPQSRRARPVPGRRWPSSIAYGFLFPGLFTVSGFAKFTQSWFPLALVAMAQAILMLTGGISLAIGAIVSLGAVISATTMAGPLGVAGGAAGGRRRRACASAR